MKLSLVTTVVASVTILLASVPTASLPVTVPVAAVEVQFLPQAVAIPKGSSITWEAIDRTHTMSTANGALEAIRGQGNDPNDSDCVVNGEIGEDGNANTCAATLAVGQPFTRTFSSTGTFWYYCQFHWAMGMVGVVRVA